MTADATSKKTGKLILYLGAEWWGSDARALAVALRQAGHCLIEVKYEDYFPLNWSSFPLRLLRRLIRPWCAANYNQAVLQHLDNTAIDFVLVFKGMLLAPETLAACCRQNLPVYGFYPDVSFAAHGGNIAACLPHYDCLFTTKEFHLRDEKLRGQVRELKLVCHGFDPEVHRPVSLSDAMRRQYACDVSFVGCWSPKKERLVNAVVQAMPDCTVKLWGPGWNKAGAAVRRCWTGRGAYGDELAVIYQCSKINLGLLSESAADTASGDQTTARTWQIPAAGGFLLHEATAELAQYLTPEKETGIFNAAEDLPERVKQYLGSPEIRERIAVAGRQRCLTGGYTYQAAAQTICAYHDNRTAN